MKKNSLVAILLLSAMFFWGCKEGKDKREFDGQVIVSGKIQNAPEGLLRLLHFLDDSPQVLEESELDNSGTFEFIVNLDGPGFYELNLMDEKIVKLALYDQDVQITHDFNNPGSFKVEGSEDSEYLQQLDALMDDYQQQINRLNDSYMEAMAKRDQDLIREIQKTAMELESNHGELVKEKLAEMKDSFASLAGLSMINVKNEFLFVDDLISGLNEKYPNTKMIQVIMAQLDDMRALSIGQVAPEISLPNPEGQLVNLSDLRGKYVLIDFWAAWCKPCRHENPNVVKLYNEYKDQGFEVFGVSLDRTKEAWVKAIEEDKLTWTHVSDLKYFNSEAAAIYQINAIPATYMLDPEGRIIAKDLRGASLVNKLKEIFG